MNSNVIIGKFKLRYMALIFSIKRKNKCKKKVQNEKLQ